MTCNKYIGKFLYKYTRTKKYMHYAQLQIELVHAMLGEL